MRYSTLVIAVGLLCCTSAHAQERHWSVVLSLPTDITWWIHHKGSEQPGVYNTRGYERTHQKAMPGVTVSARYHYLRWSVGATYRHQYLLQDDIRGNFDGDDTYERYPIAEGEAVLFGQCGGVVQYAFYQKAHLALQAVGELGGFYTNTVHYDRERFGRQWYWRTALEAQWSLSAQWYAEGGFGYTTRRILPNDDAYYHEKHDIHGLGFTVGVGLRL